MAYTFYRGDSRTPKQIKEAGGFKAWVPLNEQQARDLVARFNGAKSQVSLPAQKKDLQDTLNKGETYKLIDLVRMVKLEKNSTTIHISTDLSEDCGGYASGHVYEIVFDDLCYYDKNKVLTTNPESLECTSHFNSFVVVGKDQTLNTAKTIAISSKGNEVSFLTSIPYANIKRYRDPGQKTWNNMP